MVRLDKHLLNYFSAFPNITLRDMLLTTYDKNVPDIHFDYLRYGNIKMIINKIWTRFLQAN